MGESYYQRNREKILAKQREYYKKHRAERLAYSNAYNLEHREKINKRKKLYRERNADKIATYKKSVRTKYKELTGNSYNIFHHAVERGEIAPQPCAVCGKTPAEGHHCDYNKPLDVIWLCVEHHHEWHRHNKPIYINK